jgi:hypothetical protein
MKFMTDDKPLIGQFSLMGSNHISEELLAIAYNIEQALLNAGAIPGKDYTYLDLFQLAQPFVLEMFKIRDKMEYDYPADKVTRP